MNKIDKGKTLYYFTESYPYGIAQQWKKDELEVLKEYFDRIIVIPRIYGDSRKPSNLVEGVEYQCPLIEDFSDTMLEKARALLVFLVKFSFLKEIYRNKVYFSLDKIRNFIWFGWNVGLLFRNKEYIKILIQNDENTILYYYWGIGSVSVIPFVKEINSKVFCRFHRGDLYPDQHLGDYIPYQKHLIEKLDFALPCSDHGGSYLKREFPHTKSRIVIARLGVVGKGKNLYSSDSVLKLVSCSFVKPVKRLDIICSALLNTDISVSWTHIGGGELLDEIKQLSKQFPSNVKTSFLGTVPSGEVNKIYTKQHFDLFINVSESEGVPVSIMEAFAASVPVYATNVGGTNEIVDDSVGKLLPSNLLPEQLCGFLEEFHRLSDQKKIEFRKKAYSRYRERCDAVDNAKKLASLLVKSW